MVNIKVQKEPDCWRVAIQEDHKLVVLEEIFDNEAEAIIKAASLR